ncbi:protein translocase subunit SecF [Variovorax sp. PCZ-1]|uniref:protein translocase subunit SecF n=1 Tax=Variovorax sp. PCZ-1 TaxID=2835533 RepID=UPI001BCB62C3|nr:protein translocase subunit SecF [Variovorax sp. PCZ-1]MBS7808851.1 protein translocase subunit SecF [Variovorax sp. PCZ-1]
MEFFRIKRDIPFMKHAIVLNAISLITFVLAVFFILTRGLHLSVEFTGGTLVEVEYPQAAQVAKTREAVEKLGFGEVQVQLFGSASDVLIRVANKALPSNPAAGTSTSAASTQSDTVLKVFESVCQADGGAVQSTTVVSSQGETQQKLLCKTPDGKEPVKLQRSEFVGPSVGAELVSNGLIALGMTVLGIMIYLAFRFEWKFAVAGIIANLHDIVIILGFFAFFQWEFSLAVLAAILAVLGYSVNESVVIFDRIREAFRKYRKMTTREVIDHAITSTISRTIITHGSTEMMVLSMLIFGGPTLFYFALALTIGILFGIYSSVFVAAAIAMWLGVKREDLIKTPIKKEGEGPTDPNDPNSGAMV